MSEIDAKTFKSGNSVAVRLPKELGFHEGEEVVLRKIGTHVEIVPKARRKMTPRELVEALRALPKPATVQKRDKIIFPKRKGL